MKKTIVILLVFFAIFGCAKNKFKIGQDLLKQKKYAAAIEYFDNYLYNSTDSTLVLKNRNGALKTLVELERSKAYYSLGLIAYQKKQWKLANRMFFLSNSAKADSVIDNSYFELVKIAKNQKDTDAILHYYNYIVSYLKTSELIPSILYDRILIYLNNFNNNELAWADFIMLHDSYPDSPYLQKATLQVENFLPKYINDAVAMKNIISKDVAIDRLFELNKYKTKFNNKISHEIAITYLEMSKDFIKDEKYKKAEETLQKAINFDNSIIKAVDEYKIQVCNIFVLEAENLLNQKKVDEAISKYRQCFIFIPLYKPALNAIKNAVDVNNKIIKAQELATKAVKLVKLKQNKKALTLYKKSYKLHKNVKVKKQIFLLQNLIKIKQNSVAFAKEIIVTAKNGYISKKIKKLQNKLKKTYGEEGIKISTWKVLFSLGKDKYEVRYDIITPDETYFFVWQVDLQTRKISALNKKTEKMFEKAYK